MRHSVFAICAGLAAITVTLFSAPQETPAKSKGKKAGSKKVETPHPFYWAVPDPLRGDWQGQGGYVAQVIRADDKLLSINDQLPDPAEYGTYQANIFHAFDVANDKPVAVLKGGKEGDR